MLQRIPNQESDAASSAAANTDASRRAEERRHNEAETRERAAKFKAALGRQDAESAQGKAQLQGAAARDRAQDKAQSRATQERSDARGRDRAAAADVLSRMGLGEAGQGDRPDAASGRGAAGGKQGPGGNDDLTGQAGGPDGAKPQGGAQQAGAADASGVERGGLGEAQDLQKEVEAIEDAVQQVIDSPAGSEAATPPAEALAIPEMTPWARPEGPARPEAPRQLPQPAPGAELYHKLLMGQGPAGAEARLSITQGPLAGLQIHLTHGPGGVQAAVLTQGASSRQTLVSAMEQVAQRLRQKGHSLDVRLGGPGAQGPGQPPRRG